jgi:endoglucanase
MRTLTAIVLAACACGGAWAQPPAAAPATQPAPYTPGPGARASTGIALPLGRCVNLSNMLETPREGIWGRPFQDADATRIREAGFTTVRLPVRFSGRALAAAPYTIDQVFMARVRHVVDVNLAAGLNVILDLHNYDELMRDPDGHRVRFAALWRQIAAEFRNAPANLWFELINEPHDRLTDATLAGVLTPALAEVRATNPTRPVIVGGQSWSGIDSLATLTLPDDPYIVPTFHYYDPFDFTHQGADWVQPSPPRGRRFGTPADHAQLEAALGKVRAYRARTGRVPFMGEYGAFEQVPMDQRVAYYRIISAAFASAGIQGCVWGYTNTFHFWRDGSGWTRELLGAISTTTTVR